MKIITSMAISSNLAEPRRSNPKITAPRRKSASSWLRVVCRELLPRLTAVIAAIYAMGNKHRQLPVPPTSAGTALTPSSKLKKLATRAHIERSLLAFAPGVVQNRARGDRNGNESACHDAKTPGRLMPTASGIQKRAKRRLNYATSTASEAGRSGRSVRSTFLGRKHR